MVKASIVGRYLLFLLLPLWGNLPGQEPGGENIGTSWVDPYVYYVGPISRCGQTRLPTAGGGGTILGCPSLVMVVPGHYDPVPKQGWRLVGSTRLWEQKFSYECVSHWILGVIPVPISQECLGPYGPERGPTFVLSWEAVPMGMEKEPAGAVAPDKR